MTDTTSQAGDWFELLSGKLGTQELAARLFLSQSNVPDAIQIVRYMGKICGEAADLMQQVVDGESPEWRKFDA